LEQTFIMIKPDGVERGHIGEIVARFERKGLRLTSAQLMQVSRETAELHYGHLKNKPFFGELVDYITSGQVFAMIWEGDEAIKNARTLIGATNPVEALPGSIRGDLALNVASNIIHGSDSTESVIREIALFFGKESVVTSS